MLWENDLTIDQSALRQSITFVIKMNQTIEGFGLLQPYPTHLELDHFWLATKIIGRGYGGQLINHIIAYAQSKNMSIELSSDPNAEGFYKRYGFEKIAEQKSRPDGRTIPRMRLNYL